MRSLVTGIIGLVDRHFPEYAFARGVPCCLSERAAWRGISKEMAPR
jgi:hypothetical protein